MYQVERNGRMILEADACGIGFLASRKGVAQRRIVEQAIELTKNFDHRGAPGHGSGFQIDIPWGLLLDRFKDHTKLVAQHDVALGMFFLPFDSKVRQKCIEEVERISALAGVKVLDWKDVPVNPIAEKLLVNFDPSRFKVVKTNLVPEWLPEWSQEPTAQVL